MPHVTYVDPLCPWPDCGFRFDCIDFRLEHIDPAFYRQGLLAWHAGLSLIGPCPRCGQEVAFSRNSIARGKDAASGSVRLPTDWFRFAVVTAE